jgi:hypothetical protein
LVQTEPQEREAAVLLAASGLNLWWPELKPQPPVPEREAWPPLASREAAVAEVERQLAQEAPQQRVPEQQAVEAGAQRLQA